jgi:hypothetical protein
MKIKKNNRMIYVTIDSGEFVTEVKEDDKNIEFARKKKTKAGKVKWLLPIEDLDGVIQKLKHETTDIVYDGKDITIESILLTIKNDKETFVLQTGFNDYGNDLLKRLPALTFGDECMLRPYSFKDETGKIRSGIVIYQEKELRSNGEYWAKKITNYYYDKEEKKYINDYPNPAGDEKDSDDWKMYYMRIKKFLKNSIEGLNDKIQEANKSVFDDPPEEVEDDSPEAPQEGEDNGVLPF